MARPAKYVIDPSTKRPIVGISLDKANGEYFLTHFRTETPDGKRVNFGRDFTKAVSKFYAYMDSKGKKVVTLDARVSDNPYGPRINRETGELTFSYKTVSGDIDINAMIDIVKRMIADDRSGMEKRLEVKFATDSDLFGSKYTLKNLIDHFCSQPKYLDTSKLKRSIRNDFNSVKISWSLFGKVIGKCNVGDITKEDIRKFKDYLQINQGERADMWIFNHMSAVKRVLNVCVRNLDNTKFVEQLQTWAENLLQIQIKKRSKKTTVKMISSEDFKTILENSDKLERCLWLLSANACYYRIDLMELPVKCLDLNRGVILGHARVKNNSPRVNWLWKETIDAVKNWISENPNQGELLFSGLAEFEITKRFKKVLKDCKLEKKYNHTHFRDSFSSIARLQMSKISNGNGFVNVQDSIDVCMGHGIRGMGQAYTSLDVLPEIGKTASKLVGDYYGMTSEFYTAK